jgi:hypothetical protein
MGRFCAWESAYYLAHFDSRAARRWRGGANATVGNETLAIRYWSKSELLHALAPTFQLIGVCGVGTLLPPSYLFHWVDRRPRLFHTLAAWERRTAHLWPFSRIGDHTLVILQRV